MEQTYENDIAIIGMAGRFPKAKDINAYWENLKNGLNSVSRANEEEKDRSGISKELLNYKRFVNASSSLEDGKYFDADFFGLSNTEAMLMDPQIRLLLQTSWHALEDAGYATNNLDASVGNFCGMSTNSYLIKLLETNSELEEVDPLLYRILNEKDFLATWISYKLNLTGPAFTVQTACSTSLLAIHLACQSLLNHECSMALAGGSTYDSADSIGYVYVPEGINSKDGNCRPFDKDASGTIMGEGVGAIVLKRAEDAIKDNDNIYALIKGTAINNDGGDKQGYTIPSVDFQRAVILETLAVSDIHPDTIGMIEAHGTGTLIGDPIEVSALTEAFREYSENKQFCAIGSVKSNIGHLDAAAGVASFIKAVLCVNNGVLVPSINYSTPNPALQLETSPFYVNEIYQPWPDHFSIRRAGISSLGVGGTNVHTIIEQAPERLEQAPSKGPHVIRLSAVNENSLNLQKSQLIEFLEANPNVALEDIEFTSIYGRKVMPHRFSLVCDDKEELIAQLNGSQNEKCYEGHGDLVESVFLFPGQGSQFNHMSANLYENNEAFKSDMDYCFDYLNSSYQINFKEIIFSDDASLNNTENTQISLFIVEYCLAQKLLREGVKPSAIIGHSLGEYVAACIVGCISLDDALQLVYHRGRLMGAMPKGGMLLVKMTEEELKPLLLESITICVYNTKTNLVVGGTLEEIEKQSKVFDAKKVKYRKLKVSHAYHTEMMRGALEEYEQILSKIEFNKFDGKIFSTYTGALVDSEQLCSSKYWLDQIINPVKYTDAVEGVTNYLSNPVFIEVGPGTGLTAFTKAILDQQNVNAVNLLPKSSSKSSSSFQEAKALLCAKGLVFDSPSDHKGKRISMPGYVFSKNYFWKPKYKINYKDFSEIKQSFHNTNKSFQSDRLKSSVEIQITKDKEISEKLLSGLNELHTKYINDVKKLLSKEEQLLEIIEVFYDDVSYNAKEDSSEDNINSNQKRNVNSIFVEPSTDVEKTIAEYWGSVLGYQPVGVLDNYFEVGGNSLLATQLMTQLSDNFNIELTFKELSDSLTIKELASLINSKLEILELVGAMEFENDNDENFIEL